MGCMSRREGIGGLALGLLALIVAMAIGVALVVASGDQARPSSAPRPAATEPAGGETTQPPAPTQTEEDDGRGRGRGRGGDEGG